MFVLLGSELRELEAFTGTRIKLLLEDENGRVWVGGSRGLRRFDDGPHTLVPDTIEWVIEPLVDMIGVHPVIHADRGNLGFDKDAAGFNPGIGSVHNLDLAGFRYGHSLVVFVKK